MTRADIGDQRHASTTELVRLLTFVRNEPGSAEATSVFPFLSAQGRLAKYVHSQRGIQACSLNTLKRSCALLPGGFTALDELRCRALAAIKEDQGPTQEIEASSKRKLQERTQRLQAKLQAATEDLLLLTRLLERSMRQARQYAVDSKSAGLLERCAREQAELRDMSTMRKTPPPSLRLVGRKSTHGPAL